MFILFFFFFSSRRRHTSWTGDWSSDVCSSDLCFLAADALHLDHLGAEIGQHHAAARAGLETRQFQHAHAVETEWHSGPRDLCRLNPPLRTVRIPDAWPTAGRRRAWRPSAAG